MRRLLAGALLLAFAAPSCAGYHAGRAEIRQFLLATRRCRRA